MLTKSKFSRVEICEEITDFLAAGSELSVKH